MERLQIKNGTKITLGLVVVTIKYNNMPVINIDVINLFKKMLAFIIRSISISNL